MLYLGRSHIREGERETAGEWYESFFSGFSSRNPKLADEAAMAIVLEFADDLDAALGWVDRISHRQTAERVRLMLHGWNRAHKRAVPLVLSLEAGGRLDHHDTAARGPWRSQILLSRFSNPGDNARVAAHLSALKHGRTA